jgi:putative hydrolase of the HAD superfamily
MAEHTWIFDLDQTLYPAGTGVFAQVEVRIRAYVMRALGLGPEAAHAEQQRFWRTYGTTLRGLMVEHAMDPAEYLAYVHDVDLSPIPVDPRLDGALRALPGTKLVFTNAHLGHADRVLAHLGIAHHFADVFDIAAAGWIPKPERGPYDALVARHGFDPRRAVMFEDVPANLVPAAELGMTTVLVGAGSSDGRHVHHVTDDLPAWLVGAAGTSAVLGLPTQEAPARP